jgi:hypothetical protein
VSVIPAPNRRGADQRTQENAVKSYRFVLLAAAVMAFSLGGNWEPGAAEAAVTTVDVHATGAEEVPAVVGPVSAYGRFRFDDVAQTLDYSVTVSGASPDFITAAHIHRGARGVNGPIVHNLSTSGFTQVSGRINLSAADVRDLLAGDFYLNVHTRDHTAGAARAQIFLPTASGLEAVYRRLIEAGNRGDIDSLLSFYGPNATFTGGTICGAQPCVGRAAIRRHFENLVAIRTNVSNIAVGAAGNELRYRTDVVNDATRAAGVDRVIVTGGVSFAGGSIERHSVGFDASDPQTARFLAFTAARMPGPGGITPPATGSGGLLLME